MSLLRPSLHDGDRLEVAGALVRLKVNGRARRVSLRLDRTRREIVATAPSARRLAEAAAVLTRRTAHYAAQLDAPMPKVALTDAKSRWGSCKPGPGGTAGVIRYSWRLALAPFAVADYVVAHECVHLRELNHGPRFWAHVRDLVGDERPHRAWLRAEGARLHAFGG